LSRTTPFASFFKRRRQYLFSIVCTGLLLCAGLLGTHTSALADQISHIPSVDVYPTVSWATGNDEYGSPGGPDPCNNYFLPGACPDGFGSLTGGDGITNPNAGDASGGLRAGVLDVNVVVTVPLLKGLAFQYEHDRAAGIDTTIGRVTGQYANPLTGHNTPTNTYIYPASNNDIVDTFRLSYSGIKGVGVTLGSFYRFRHDNAATNDPSNLAPADWHEQFLSLSYTTPAIEALNGLTVGANVDGEYNKHHVSGDPSISPYAAANDGSGLQSAAYAGYSDTDGKARYGLNYGFNANLPINHSFAIFGSWQKGAFDFFDNSPVPFYYIIDDVGILKKFNKVLTLTADTNNLTQYNLGGVPFYVPNTIHRVYFDVALDIHLGP
jgi:hypothetical protein